MDKRTFDDFDEFADNYRAIHTANVQLSGADSFYFAEMKVRLLNSFEQNDKMMVLDFGCGDGTTESFMQQYFSNWLVTGIDISNKSIDAAREKNITSSTFQQFDGINIPIGANLVDIVFVAGVLHHVNYELHSIILNEINRVLKPGGRFYLFEHNPNNPLTRYLVNTCVFDRDARLLRSSYTIKLLKSAGFLIKAKRFIIFFPRKGLLSKFMFMEKYLQWLPVGGQYFIQAIK